MLETRNLKISYAAGKEDLLVVDGMNVQIQPGNLIMLAGRNGSGKSSLLRVLAGLQQFGSGEVLIGSESITGKTEPELASLVSIMFSTPPVMELTTAGELVLTAMQRHFSPFKLDFTKEWNQVENSMRLCGMEEYMHRDFQSLSDGEKQKVMLARCLAQDTPVLLLDEPLAFLDYPSRRDMLNLLHHLAVSENKIIIFSSHDLDISLTACDALLLLRSRGAWTYYNSTEKIRTLDPMELFVES